MPGLKMQAASKISSDGALNLLELEENFGLWKGMRSMERYDVYGCLIAVYIWNITALCFHAAVKDSFLFVASSGMALVSSVPSRLF